MFYQILFGLACLAAITACVRAQRDATLQYSAKGKEVTEAVLRKLTLSKIFPEDHSFFLRLAYTETGFGEKENRLRTDYYGGIWAVAESVLRLTKSANLTSQHTSIIQKFQINWTNTEWRDLRKPMYSGIAVALHFHFEVRVAIPQKIEDQAKFWQKHYRPQGNVTEFIKDAEKLQNETTCRGKFDLCIVLDSSGSIGLPNYKLATNFIGNMIESFSRDFTRFGMLIYSTDTQVIFRVNNTNTPAQLASMARNAPYLSDGTNTHLGILEAITLLKEVDDNSKSIPKIITVFTDGESTGGAAVLEQAIESMKINRIKPLSIGIGIGVKESELRQIALNDPASVFMLQDFAALKSFFQQLTSVTCEISQAPELNETYSDFLIQYEKRIYKIESAPEGITITISVTVGSIKGYWSHWNPVPTEALNDGIIDGPTFIPAPPRFVRRKRQIEGDGQEPLTNIYITIQGKEPTNNYTFMITEGNQANGAPMVSLGGIVVAVVAIFHILF